MKCKICPHFYLFLMLFFVGCGPAKEGQVEEDGSRTLEITTLTRGAAGNGEPGEVFTVVESAEEWERVMQELPEEVAEVEEPPQFGEEVAIVTYSGQRPSGGFTIDVKQVQLRDSTLFVLVEEARPGPGCMRTDALTFPYHVVKVEKVPFEEVKFQQVGTTRECEE